MPDWGALFIPETPLLELVIRGSVIYLAMLVLMRMAGQREAGGLGITDLLVVVLVAEAASGGLVGDATSLTDGLVVVVVIFGWSVAIDAISYMSPRFAAVVKARPRALVEDGAANRPLMRRELMTDEELDVQLRLHGITDVAEVKRAILEPNGMISVLPVQGQESEGAPDKPAGG